MILKSKPESAEGAEVTENPRVYSMDRLSDLIIGAAIEVHRQTGPGLLEAVYEECLCYELSRLNLRFRRQVELPVGYKGIKLDCGFRMDILVEDAIVLELKTVDQLLPIHAAQLLTYLKLSGKQVGLLLNFNEPILKKGIKRLVNHFKETPLTSAASALQSREDANTASFAASHLKNSAPPRLGGEYNT
jgi:GxxExxY protein